MQSKYIFSLIEIKTEFHRNPLQVLEMTHLDCSKYIYVFETPKK